jgi:hypothetical protein
MPLKESAVLHDGCKVELIAGEVSSYNYRGVEMSQKSGTAKLSSGRIVKDIRRATRKQYSAEEKIRIVLEGLRSSAGIRRSRTASFWKTIIYPATWKPESTPSSIATTIAAITRA